MFVFYLSINRLQKSILDKNFINRTYMMPIRWEPSALSKSRQLLTKVKYYIFTLNPSPYIQHILNTYLTCIKPFDLPWKYHTVNLKLTFLHSVADSPKYSKQLLITCFLRCLHLFRSLVVKNIMLTHLKTCFKSDVVSLKRVIVGRISS